MGPNEKNETDRKEKNMKKTLSASVDPEVYEALGEAARAGGTSKSAVVSGALRLYTSLPPASRRAFREGGPSYGPAFRERVRREVELAILRSRWEELADRIDERGGEGEPSPLSEEDLLEAAEAAVRQARKRPSGG